MNSKQTFIWVIIVFLVLALGVYLGYYIGFERGSRAKEQTVREDTYLFTSDVIRVHSPRANEPVTSPVTIRGEAVGNWFFEASMPVRIVDRAGRELGSKYVMTADEWMTTDFVSFEGTIDFDPGEAEVGYILFQKDNPSGLPEHDAERRMPVRF